MKKFLLINILFLLCTLTLFAQNKLSVIKDADGFTNVRSGQGKEFSIIGTIEKDEFFYCNMMTKNEWVEIFTLGCSKEQIKGYIHRSRVQLVENLNYKKQKELIIKIFDKQIILNENFIPVWKNRDKDMAAYQTAYIEHLNHSYCEYSSILGILPKYFCSTNDIEIIKFFFATMWADNGSANEQPSFAIGDCFVCRTNIIIEQLKKIKNVEQKEFILDHIEWGLLNHFNIDENEKSDNKEYNRLKKLLDNERQKINH